MALLCRYSNSSKLSMSPANPKKDFERVQTRQKLLREVSLYSAVKRAVGAVNLTSIKEVSLVLNQQLWRLPTVKLKREKRRRNGG